MNQYSLVPSSCQDATNQVSLSSGERAGVRAGLLDTNFSLRFRETGLTTGRKLPAAEPFCSLISGRDRFMIRPHCK
jgi:hypothetical protein